jgi:hypothetical protein
MAALTSYFERFREGDTSIPSEQALKPLSKLLDAVTLSVVTDLMQVLRASNEHQARVGLLQIQNRTAGKFSRDKILLQNASNFEQMIAMADWLSRVRIRDSHTFFISGLNDDYIPVQVKKYPKLDANMMHVRLGATSGAHKAPKYTDWAASDPWRSETQKVFIYALEALEIVRQPQFSAATIIKGNAFESEYVESEWRYGSAYACVEDKGQSKGGQPKTTPKKEKSAGLNAVALADALSDAADPIAIDTNLCTTLRYEDYSDDGYIDDLDISVSPGAFIQAAETAVVDQDTSDLTRLMENLVISKLQVPRTPMLCNYVVQKLIANNAAG